MRAVILAGGEGTRLRPLTLSTPKPVVPVVDRPFLRHQIDLLASAGVREVVFSVAYRPERVEAVFGDGSALGVRIRYAVEDTPLGTGGAVRHALELLDERTIVMNGDVLTDVDLARPRAPSRGRACLGDHPAHARRRTPPPTASWRPTPRAACFASSRSRRPTRSRPTRSTRASTSWKRACWTSSPPGSTTRSSAASSRPCSPGATSCSAPCTAATGSTSARPRSTSRSTATSCTAASASRSRPSRARRLRRQGARVAPEAALEPPFYVGPAARSSRAPGRTGRGAGARRARPRGRAVRDSVLWTGVEAGAHAVVEASLVGPGVRIGPHALVRGALLGEGSVVSDHSKTCWESPR